MNTENARSAALDFLRADCRALAAAARARGYPKADVSYAVKDGGSSVIAGYEAVMHTDVGDGRWKVHKGPDPYGQAAAWIEALPQLKSAAEIAAEIAPWFITTLPPPTAGNGGGSACPDNRDGAAAASPEIPRSSPAADGGGPAHASHGERAAVELTGRGP